MVKAKPFLKWAGGKSQLLPTIDMFLPASFRYATDVTYIEPFVGGGAMLFYMLGKYPNISRAVINDINPHLIKTYKVIRNHPYLLIEKLKALESSYRRLEDYALQKDFYLDIRNKYNTEVLSDIEESAYLIFMNRTCFNGLYRENAKGVFNVPFGKYSNPTICDEQLIESDSEILKRVEILNGDFSKTIDYVNGSTLLYLDPPYRPLDATSNFNSYVKEPFDDSEQIRLKRFYDLITSRGAYALLSNSDGRSRNESNLFFDELYKDYIIERVYAKRCINANPAKRGTLTELLIRNYTDVQGYNNK